MKKLTQLFLATLIVFGPVKAQVKIGDNPTVVSPGSILELESTSKALVLPRMTTLQMQAIPSPLSGMIIFNIDSNCLYLYKTNNIWASLTTASNQSWPYQTNDLAIGTNGNAKGIIAATGNGLIASGNYSHAEGLNSQALGAHAWSFGFGDTAVSPGSNAAGYQNKTYGDFSVALGFKNITGYQSAVALGQENQDSGWSSLAMGLRNSIYNGVAYSNALGYSNVLKTGSSNNVFGESNTVNSGRANAGIGLLNALAGDFNTAVGYNNKILAGSGSVAAGVSNNVTAGIGNMLLGSGNSANGVYLGAIGKDNNLFNQSAVALGQGNTDSGWASIAGGLNNVIEHGVQYSASFGYNNITTGNDALPVINPGSGSFTGGISNVNAGFGSIALGFRNRPSNFYSFAANANTLSNSHAMSAFGHFNDTIAAFQGESYNGSEMLFSIGNGINNTSRRNSFTMLRNGFTTINASTQAGPNIPRAELDVKGTGAIIVPVGTSSQRPESPVMGMIRFCTDCGTAPVLQGYDGTAWVNL